MGVHITHGVHFKSGRITVSNGEPHGLAWGLKPDSESNVYYWEAVHHGPQRIC
jgi:hypothetical protein